MGLVQGKLSGLVWLQEFPWVHWHNVSSQSLKTCVTLLGAAGGDF
jgi:hypothetical protein